MNNLQLNSQDYYDLWDKASDAYHIDAILIGNNLSDTARKACERDLEDLVLKAKEDVDKICILEHKGMNDK